MDNVTTQLINELAQKSGTTTEYLWNVLIKQVKINAMMDLCYYIIIIILGIIIYNVHKYLRKPKNEYGFTGYDKHDGLDIIMIVITGLWGLIALICFFNIGNTITAFINPEYWALKQIIK